MVSSQALKKVFVIFFIISLCSCSNDKETEKTKKGTPPVRQSILLQDEGFFGWNSLTLRNAFVRLDVVPELGGKIMGFDLQGYQILWHDPAKEGIVEKNQGYGFGEKYFNPGGAKVWPAPQGWNGPEEWPGPPDNVLDSSSYEFSTIENSINVVSPKDDGTGRTGLQYNNTYTLIPSSTITELHLSMTNVVNRPVKWGLSHVVTLPVNSQFTVYVPVDNQNLHVIHGEKDNPQWLGVKDGLFRMRYDKRVGKVSMKAREGWAAWHDEENNIVFAMLFPVTSGAEYPDNGSNFAIWTNGSGTLKLHNQEQTLQYSPETAMMELEVMGPLTQLAPGRSSSMDVTWGICRCSGVKKVLPVGVVVEDLTYKDNVVSGKFGVFYGGILQLVFLEKEGKQRGITNVMDVSPLTEVSIHLESRRIVPPAYYVRYQIANYDQQVIGILGTVKVK